MGGLTTPICVGTTSDGLSMAGVKVVVLEDACASQPFEGFSAQDAHAFAIARFRYQFGQTMTTQAFGDSSTGGLPPRRDEGAARQSIRSASATTIPSGPRT